MTSRIRRYADRLLKRAHSIETGSTVAQHYTCYRDNPAGFVRDVLGAESATRRSTGERYQFEILDDLAIYPRVTVKSGHGIGKTTVDAWATIWWLLTRPLSRVVIVAPEFSRQVRAVLLGEIRHWLANAPEQLPLEVRSRGVTVLGHGDEWSAIGMPATEPNRIEGFHSSSGLLLILDEAKGIDQGVYDALQGALSGLEENRLLVTSTPGDSTSFFYRLWTRNTGEWRYHHVPSTDSSNVSPAWCNERATEWGEGSPLYQARVLGEFAKDGHDVLLRVSDLEAAVRRDLGEKRGAIRLGVDPARFGPDTTALAVWCGGQLLRVEARQGLDTMEVASWVAGEINSYHPEAVWVDEVGVGSGVVDRLNQLRYAIIRGVNGSVRATRPDLYANCRAEVFWRLRAALEKGEVSLPDDDRLIAELSAIRFQYSARGQIQIESKDETKRRIGRSPDLADAVVLGFSDARGRAESSGSGLSFLEAADANKREPPPHEMRAISATGQDVYVDYSWVCDDYVP